MVKLLFVLALVGLGSVQGQTEPALPNVAIKIDPETDHVTPLPLSASEAARRFGQLEPGQLAAVTAMKERLFAALDDPQRKNWTGPTLMLSRSSRNLLADANLTSFRNELGAGTMTVFDPYSLGKRADATDAVIVARLGSGSTVKLVAFAFVLQGATIQRIVLAPQPWITLMQNTR